MAENKASAKTESNPAETIGDAPQAPDDAVATDSAADPDANEELQARDETLEDLVNLAQEQSEGGREAELEAEVAALKDQLLRAVAESENVRRRGQRDREEAVKYGAVALLRDILGVADNLERALESIPVEAAESDERVKALLTGVQMIERELHSVLERHKVERLVPQDQPFDPHLHEAMFELPDPSKQAGTVVQVMQPGYRLHDRLLRPARVAIAKGGAAKADQTGDGAAANGGGAGTPEPGSRVDTEA